MKRNIRIFTGLLTVLFLTSSCNKTKKSELSQSIDDKTPIVDEELSDLPPDMTFNDARSVLDVLGGITSFDTFHKSLRSTDMMQLLDSLDEVTVFAPTNEAFNRITESKLAHLQTPEGAQEMKQLLQYHLVADEYDFETLESTIRLNENMLRLETLNGDYIALSIENDEIYITDELGFQSKITNRDMEAENGVVHALNAVLLEQRK